MLSKQILVMLMQWVKNQLVLFDRFENFTFPFLIWEIIYLNCLINYLFALVTIQLLIG